MLLITPDEVLVYAFSPREKITPGSIRYSKIDVAQERFIRPVLGEEMFDNLAQGKFRPFVNEYIKPALAHYVRYGVISEFSIRMGDDGAVLIQGDDTETSSNRKTDVKNDSTRRTLSEQQQTQTKNSENESNSDETGTVVTRSDENKSVTLTKNSSDESNITQSDTTVVDRDESKTTALAKNSSGEESVVAQSDTNASADITDSGSTMTDLSGSDERRQRVFRPATDAQRNLIMRRALADADMLMAKAIRYLVRNAHLFEGFDPEAIRPSGIITGFSAINDSWLWR